MTIRPQINYTMKYLTSLRQNYKVTFHTIRLPEESTVGDVLDFSCINHGTTAAFVELSHTNAELRLLTVIESKIWKYYAPNEKIEYLDGQHWTLRAEEIPEEEKNFGPRDHVVHVCHFTKDRIQNQSPKIKPFGEPFLLVIHEGETSAETKVRVQKKLRVPADEFVKWKFAFISSSRPEYFHDSDIVSSRFQGSYYHIYWYEYLGLEHSDNGPKR